MVCSKGTFLADGNPGTSGQGKGVYLKVYTLVFITKVLSSVPCSSPDNVLLMCCTISQMKLDLLLHNQWGQPTNW